MQFLRYENLPVTQWRNRGGVTREVIAQGDNNIGFLWRVSIATIDKPGPFSPFPDIDRTISALSGDGILLTSPDGTERLTVAQPPYAFAGETAVKATLIDGPTTCLNAMSRRGALRHRMRRLLASSGTIVEGTAAHSVIVFGGSTSVQIGSAMLSAGSFDTLADIATGSVVILNAQQPTPFYQIEFATDR